MRFAYVDGHKQEATPGSRGLCPCCGSVTIAKCGLHTIRHWAHQSLRACDPWWEPETDWHRQWKSHFPSAWQEVVQYDAQTGEKHVADVRTGNGMVIEFQHSVISFREARSRERFYPRMMWVVDLNRNPTEARRFRSLRELLDFPAVSPTLSLPWPRRSKLFETWSHATVPVLFDPGQEQDLWRYIGFKGQDIEHGTEARYLFRPVPKKALIEKNGGRYSPAASSPEHISVPST